MQDAWRRAQRRWRAWRARLRRDRAALALVALLALGVFEPLACIIHCQLWIPFVLRSYFAAQHQHHHMHTQVVGTPTTPRAASAVDAAFVQHEAPIAGCTIHIGHSPGSPLPLPPSPVHEMMLTLVVSVLLVLLAISYPAAPLTGPPRVFVPVPLRPPIPTAG